MPWIWDKEDKFVIEKFDLWYKFHGHPSRRCRDSDARRRTRSHAGGNGPGSAPQAEHAPGASAHCLSEAYVCASLSESARVVRVCTVCTSPSRTMACTLCALACRGGPERESTKKSSACDRLYINRPVGRLAERAAFPLRPPKLVDHDHNLACLRAPVYSESKEQSWNDFASSICSLS